MNNFKSVLNMFFAQAARIWKKLVLTGFYTTARMWRLR